MDLLVLLQIKNLKSEDTLFYSTEGQFESEKGIEYEDISMFRKVLSENPRVKKIELFSYGGSITAGLEIVK